VTSVNKPAPLVMHSAASPDWGTPMILRHFAARVLAPAAVGTTAIDLDYASSSYWQAWWPRTTDTPQTTPQAFLDGSKGRDVLVEADRRTAAPRLGAGFLNAPGLGGGDMVQDCWRIFEEDHRTLKLGAGCWVGFSIEQFGGLQNVGKRNPLTTASADLITTIVPSRRANYVLHPEQLIAITLRKQKTRARGSKPWLVEQRLVEKLQTRTTDAPVSAGAPSHLSYITFLWRRDRAVRRAQMEEARRFLKDQHGNPKSLLHKFEVIGSLWQEGKKQ
jgi:hypothetical protein